MVDAVLLLMLDEEVFFVEIELEFALESEWTGTEGTDSERRHFN